MTAAWAPWQNGLCERVGGSWKHAWEKLVYELSPETKGEAEEIMDQVTMAHNTLVRVEGHSRAQILMGQDVRVPGLEGSEPCDHVESGIQEGEDIFTRAMNIRKIARRAMIEATDEDRVRRAALHRTRPVRGPYEPGELIMLWQKGKGEKKAHWHGPHIGVHHGKVFVAYGANIYRCAPEQVRKVQRDVQHLTQWLPDNMRKWKDTIRQRGAGNVVELDMKAKPSDDHDMEVDEDGDSNQYDHNRELRVVVGQGGGHGTMNTAGHEGNMHTHEHEQDGNASINMSQEDSCNTRENEESDGYEPSFAETGAANSERDGAREMETSETGEQTNENDAQHQAMEQDGNDSQRPNETNANVQRPNETNANAQNMQNASVAASSYGPVRTAHLTRALRRSLDDLDFGHVRLSQPQDESRVVNMKDDEERPGAEEVYVMTAKKMSRKEISAKGLSKERLQELEVARRKEWTKMETSQAVKVHRGEEARKMIYRVRTDRVLDSRYVYTTGDGLPTGPLKARWCIRGYLDPDLMDLETASPTLSSEAFAVVTQLIASFRWRMSIADIEAAFLRGGNISRSKGVVLVRVPKDGIPGCLRMMSLS